MPDTTNVIEVDFARKPAHEDLAQDIADGFAAVRVAIEWEQDQMRRLRARARTLRKEIDHERKLNFPFSDGKVLVALRRVYDSKPVAAGDVARALTGMEPTHSARVRTGKALSRLAKRGMVIQHEPENSRDGRIACRWEAADA